MHRTLVRLAWLAVLIGVFVVTAPARTKAQSQRGATAVDTSVQGPSEADRLRLAIARDKASVVADLMSRWSDHIQDEKALHGFERSFTAADPEKLLRMVQARTWESVIAISLGLDGPKAFGSQLTDLVFTPLTPCRVLDTRLATGIWHGPFSSPAEISFYVTDPLTDFGHTQGGQASCGFPFNVGTGVALNITVVPAGNSGDLKVYPFGATAPNSSIINFINGLNLANAADTAIALSNSTNDVTIQVEFATNVHIIVDVMGYYSAPNASALDATRVAGATTAVAPGSYSVSSAACPTGYALVGGGYNETVATSDNWIWQSGPTTAVNPPTTWVVRGNNLTGSTLSLTVYAVCARTPGR